MSHRNQKSYRPRVLVDKGNQKSCTVPGQETNLKQILAQHSRGMPLPQGHEGQYFGDLDVPDFEEMDIIELAEYTKSLRDEIEFLKGEINKPITVNKQPEATGNPSKEPEASQEPKPEAKPL